MRVQALFQGSGGLVPSNLAAANEGLIPPDDELGQLTPGARLCVVRFLVVITAYPLVLVRGPAAEAAAERKTSAAFDSGC